MFRQTHYQVLGVNSSATVTEIYDAYQSILRSNNTHLAHNLGPFARASGEHKLKQAKVALDILADTQTRREYDDTLPPISPSGRDRPSMTNITSDEAQYRYMSSSLGTEVQVAICDWYLTLNISSKFRFQNDLTELSKHEKGAKEVGFEISLERDTLSEEYRSPSINELTVKVQDMPRGLRVISVKSLFKETSSASSLTLSIIAESCPAVTFFDPWTYGFDFDLNESVPAESRATHLIFTQDEPAHELKVGQELRGCPEFVVKRDDSLKIDAFVGLQKERCLKLRHGGVELWRLAAVGYKTPRLSYPGATKKRFV